MQFQLTCLCCTVHCKPLLPPPPIAAIHIRFVKYFLFFSNTFLRVHHRAPTHSPLPLRVAKTCKNHLNEEITPLLPTMG
jgi:hypothetical protein